MEVRKTIRIEEAEIEIAVLEYLKKNYSSIGEYQAAYIHVDGNGNPPFMSMTFLEELEKKSDASEAKKAC
ncbi:hypothetical protein PP749_gp026 [Rhizobium phage RHEph22]|uniref:Uncharacterized protein n=1 Tax=Rhizobium phage RHEph22 TaxID=2836135 RepID=A0AAE7VN75_9CAUD|nr:hypothetical protein PP749_gp026 [Rhizobium phage RHEph22]QXV74699.1 hypothetical protein [Rhizobium phage RHEph22]QXV74794.1 hypothetical protein [Rhizobium phage RHEph24]